MAKSLSPAIRTGGSLSEDLISDILLRLTVKLILRCKAVSKSWKTLISSPHFIKSHLLRTIASSADDDETLIVHSYSYGVSLLPSVLLLNVISAEIVADLNLPYFKDEFSLDSVSTVLLGSACGIVCVGVWVRGSFDDLGKFTECPIAYIYLWNPATRQSTRLPQGPQHTLGGPQDFSSVDNPHWLIGFGFDHVSNDFKVVQVVSSTFSAEVYSTNRNCWRKVEQVACYSEGSNMCSDLFVCVKGYLCCARLSHMVAFDLNMEVLNSALQLPVISYDACITDFNDSIALVNLDYMDKNYNIKLWKLEDETCLSVGGVEASWTLMLNIDLHSEVGVHVHGYLNNGDFLVLIDEDWFLFNSVTNVIRYLPSFFYPDQYFKYTESLVTFPGFKIVDWSAGEGVMEVKDEGIDTDEDETETQGEVEDDIRNSC